MKGNEYEAYIGAVDTFFSNMENKVLADSDTFSNFQGKNIGLSKFLTIKRRTWPALYNLVMVYYFIRAMQFSPLYGRNGENAQY